jgi:hypothetical protein
VLLLLSVGEFAALLITWPLFIADGEEDRFDQDFQVVDRLWLPAALSRMTDGCICCACPPRLNELGLLK